MQATYVTYSFLVVTLKKEKETGVTNFYNIFNITLCILIISCYHFNIQPIQKPLVKYFTFCVLSL